MNKEKSVDCVVSIVNLWWKNEC